MIRKSAEGASRQTLGMLSVAAGVSIFSLQDAIVKGMSGSFPVHEIVFVRSLVAFPLLLIATIAEARGWPAFRRFGLHFLRGLLMYAAFTAYYLAIAHLQIAETVALFFVAPLLVAALSAPVLGEQVTPRSWIAIAIGGAGMLVILRPGLGSLDPALFLPLFAALAYALSVLCGRRLGQSQSGATMALSATVIYVFASGAMALALAGRPPPVEAMPASSSCSTPGFGRAPRILASWPRAARSRPLPSSSLAKAIAWPKPTALRRLNMPRCLGASSGAIYSLAICRISRLCLALW
jgi:Predicted permease, DMT superfamily